MSNPLFGGFVSLGDAFIKKAEPLVQTFQNSVMPNTKPANTNTFSFDFAGGFTKAVQAITQPFRTVTDPKAAAGAQVIGSIGDAASALIRAGANSAIDALKNNNKANEIVYQTGTSAGNPTPSQGFSLSDVLSFLNASKGVAGTTGNNDYVAMEAAKSSQNSIYIFGGLGLLLVLLTLTGKGR